jgi:hypothetical protein
MGKIKTGQAYRKHVSKQFKNMESMFLNRLYIDVGIKLPNRLYVSQPEDQKIVWTMDLTTVIRA